MLLNGILRRPFVMNGRTFSFVRNCFGICVMAGVVAAAEVAVAATINVSKDFSSPLSTAGVASADTHGGQMGGTLVTAGFSNGTSQSAIWAQTVPGFGGVVLLNSFYLEVGNTSASSWLLYNLNPDALLTSLTINAGPGNHVFDTVSPNPGTANSLGGSNFSDSSGLFSGVVSVTYSRPVGLTGFDPVGDIFTVMTVNFAGLDAGGIPTSNTAFFQFRQDTDSLARAGDLVPVGETPVPGAVFLMGTVLAGSVGFGAWRRKRKR